MSSKVREVPNYPGPLPKKAPAPPKYLVQVVETDNGPKHQLIQVKGTPPPIRPSGLAEPDAPVMAKYSRVVPQRDHVTPAHFYPPRQEYVPPDMKTKPKVRNSLVDVKSSSGNGNGNRENTNHSATSTSTTLTLPALPKLPTVPRPYVPPAASSYVSGPLMHARTAAGQILGTGTTRYVPAENVPYLPTTTTISTSSSDLIIPPDISSVGPDNPILQLNDIWSACWDDEAGAVYYYNQETGEATWISPI